MSKVFVSRLTSVLLLTNHNTDLLIQVVCHASDNAFDGNGVILLENVRRKKSQKFGMWVITLFSLITNVVVVQWFECKKRIFRGLKWYYSNASFVFIRGVFIKHNIKQLKIL